MKKFLLIFFVIFVFAIPFAQNTEDLIKNSPTKKDYPLADIITLKQVTTMDQRKSATISAHVYKLYKILSYSGRERYGQERVSFDKGLNKVNIIKARVYKDGKWYEVDRKKGINELSRFSALSSGDYYPNARQIVVVFPQVEVNSVIEFEYTVEKVNKKKKKKDDEKHFTAGMRRFQNSQPKLNYAYKIIFDNDKDLKFKLENDNKNYNYSYNVGKKDNEIKIEFSSEKIPQIIYESNMIRTSKFSPTFLYSNYISWDEYGKHVLKDIITKEQYKGKVFDSENDLLHFMTNEIRKVYFSYRMSGFKPSKLKKILKNKYVGEVDKAYLLYKILEKMGKKPQYVFVKYDKIDFPDFIRSSFSAFTVYADGKLYNVNSDSINYDQCYYTNCKALILGKDKVSWKKFKNEPQKMVTKLELNILDNGDADATVHYIYNGKYSSRRSSYRTVDEDDMQKRMERRVNGLFPNSKLKDYGLKNIDDRTKTPELIINFHIKYLLKFIKNRAFFTAPLVHFSADRYFSKQDRKYSMEIRNYAGDYSINEIIIKLNGLKFSYIPENLEFKEKCFNNKISFTKIKDGQLKIEGTNILIPPCEITLDEYFKLQKEVKDVSSSLENIIIKK
ncbi:DUF3857 domain-containing protein [bacterium]|nr:DUF3857 domain-containing protein [bacterium]